MDSGSGQPAAWLRLSRHFVVTGKWSSQRVKAGCPASHDGEGFLQLKYQEHLGSALASRSILRNSDASLATVTC